MNLSEHSSDVVGWDSTWDAEKQQAQVRDNSTETDKNVANVSDKHIGTQEETKDAEVQASPVVMSNSDEDTDKKLAAWLKKIMPALEKELSEGLTQVSHNNNHNSNRANASFAKVSEHQEIDVKSRFPECKNDLDLIVGNFLWLSVILQNNPVLVISCSVENNSNNSSCLLLFEPYRNKSDGNVYWKEATPVPLKDPLKFLTVNHENRDMFAGASLTGDLYVWEYDRNSSQIIEVFSIGLEDTIAGITFSTNNELICCYANNGNINSYKMLGKHNFVIDKTMMIDQKRVKDSQITAICSIQKTNEFVIGLLSGRIFYCSSNQFASYDGIVDPIVKELNPHKFAVKSLKHISQNSDKQLLISFDVSCEIFIHEIGDDLNEKSLKFVIKLPLPIKNSIAFTNNLEHIFCPLANGNLEIFNARNHKRRIIEGSSTGINILSDLSKNESWLITGVFKGTFKIFHISLEDE